MERNRYSFAQIGSSDFEKFASNEEAIFVDKTLFIKDMLEGSEVTLITRPRRWGKTLNMSMLEYFFSIPINRDGTINEEKRQQKIELFSKMKIGQHPDIIEKHCGKYPVIFVTFKDVKGSSYEAIKDNLSYVIYSIISNNRYLLESNKIEEDQKNLLLKFLNNDVTEAQFKNSILFLSELLFQHYNKKVIILIDEYDSPLNNWYVDQIGSKNFDTTNTEGNLKEILKLFSSLLGSALKGNNSLEKSVVTGILRIAKANLFSGVNNFTESSIVHKDYASDFGFTEEEVIELLHQTGMDKSSEAIDGIKSWYNGYNIGGVTIYNPWSIMNFLKEQEYKAYWIVTGSTDLLENAVMLDEFQSQMQKLINGEEIDMVADSSLIFADITTSTNAFYNLLLFSGYLTTSSIDHQDDGTSLCEVRIPNHEIRELFEVFLTKWINKKFNIGIDQYLEFINSFLSANLDVFTEKLQSYIEQSASYYNVAENKSEVFYNGFMLGLISSISSKYFVETERESGSGRVDLLVIPKSNAKYKNAFVIEYKIEKSGVDLKTTALEGLNQIKSKNYESKLKSYENIDCIIRLSLAFSEKAVEVLWE